MPDTERRTNCDASNGSGGTDVILYVWTSLANTAFNSSIANLCPEMKNIRGNLNIVHKNSINTNNVFELCIRLYILYFLKCQRKTTIQKCK